MLPANSPSLYVTNWHFLFFVLQLGNVPFNFLFFFLPTAQGTKETKKRDNWYLWLRIYFVGDEIFFKWLPPACCAAHIVYIMYREAIVVSLLFILFERENESNWTSFFFVIRHFVYMHREPITSLRICITIYTSWWVTSSISLLSEMYSIWTRERV